MRREHVDLFVSPAQGGVAPKLGERTGWPGMTAVWTFAGCPTISIPAAITEAMPIGFQCVADYGQDEKLLFWSQHISENLQNLHI